ncbi:MAG: DNA gyrase subunit A [Patescibacteria group bacterium]
MDSGKIEIREIKEEMRESYLNYAMSVIVDSALPDVRDGLKPVHRRILITLKDLGLYPNSRFRKSAKICGDVSGNYHPHGEQIVYPSMVHLAQIFKMRYPLVFSQGNFGSIDGDPPAAMRYTEAKMSKFAQEILCDLDKDTVDWKSNYDGTRKEPQVLPALLPNLIINGTMGIAVGMASNIPPHNLGEIIDGLIHLIDNPRASIDDLVGFIKGPDFPTGGIIYNRNDIVQAYGTGRGGIINRAKAEVVEDQKGRFQIITTEIPYQVNKASLIEKIAQLVKDKKIEGVRDVRDESDKDGIRIVVDLKNDVYPQKILNRLYKLTDMQRVFHLNMLALVDGIQPQVLSLKSILEYYIEHRKIIVERRTRFDLTRAKERAHILEGLKKALDHIDAVIQTIRQSKDKETAHMNLMKKFKFSDAQTKAILEMKLQTLAGLEREKIEDELKEKKKLIGELTLILETPQRILRVIKDELKALKEKYADKRRTKVIVSGVAEFKIEDLVPNEEAILVLTKGGYIKRVNPDIYRTQKRGGKGMIGMTTKEEDQVERMLGVETHDEILFFTDSGKVFKVKAYEIPESSRVSRGQAIMNFLQIGSQERVTSIISLGKEDKENKFLVMATKCGIIKKTNIMEFANVRRVGLTAIKLQKEDSLLWVDITQGNDEIILVTSKGQAIRFAEKDVRSMGRGAAGVRGIRLKKDDYIVGMDIIKKDRPVDLLVVTENGFGKKTPIKYYKNQRRGGSGIKTAKITSKNGGIIAAITIAVGEVADIVTISLQGKVIRTPLDSISVSGRSTQGVRIMRLDQEDKAVSIICL